MFPNKSKRTSDRSERYSSDEEYEPLTKKRIVEDRKQEQDHTIVQPISTADEAKRQFTTEETSCIQQLLDARPDMQPEEDENEVLNPEDVDLGNMMKAAFAELYLIIEWAKKVPGFRSLLLDDQMAMLKSSFLDLNVLRVAYRSLDFSGELCFSRSLVMSKEQHSKLGWSETLFQDMIEFVKRLRSLSIDLTEFCLLNAIVLTYSDAPGITNRKETLDLQERFLSLLNKYVLGRPVGGNAIQRHARILLCLPPLRAVSAKAAENFIGLSVDGKLKVTSLVQEMIM